jgi:hypothetical protein
LGTASNPEIVVDGDLDLVCWGPVHLKWTLVITIPSIIIWGAVFPLLALSILIKHKQNLFSYKIKSRFGWLYEGLTPSSYYWEFVMVYRKIILIVLSVFFIEIGETAAVKPNFVLI